MLKTHSAEVDICAPKQAGVGWGWGGVGWGGGGDRQREEEREAAEAGGGGRGRAAPSSDAQSPQTRLYLPALALSPPSLNTGGTKKLRDDTVDNSAVPSSGLPQFAQGKEHHTLAKANMITVRGAARVDAEEAIVEQTTPVRRRAAAAAGAVEDGDSWVKRVVGNLARVYGLASFGAGFNVAFVMAVSTIPFTLWRESGFTGASLVPTNASSSFPLVEKPEANQMAWYVSGKARDNLIARGLKLTSLCSHAPVAALLPARVGQEPLFELCRARGLCGEDRLCGSGQRPFSTSRTGAL